MTYFSNYALPSAQPGREMQTVQNNFFSNVPTVDNYNSQAGRLDQSINDNNKIFFETPP